jgi:hypothetical protein
MANKYNILSENALRLNYSKHSNSSQKYYLSPAIQLNMCIVITHYWNSKTFINLNKKSTLTKILNSHSHLTRGDIISESLITCTHIFCTVSRYNLTIMANIHYLCFYSVTQTTVLVKSFNQTLTNQVFWDVTLCIIW